MNRQPEKTKFDWSNVMSPLSKAIWKHHRSNNILEWNSTRFWLVSFIPLTLAHIYLTRSSCYAAQMQAKINSQPVAWFWHLLSLLHSNQLNSSRVFLAFINFAWIVNVTFCWKQREQRVFTRQFLTVCFFAQLNTFLPNYFNLAYLLDRVSA